MSKGTLYLKYRPAQLEDVVGQKFTVATLKQASISDKFAHAYLFSGNKGCGKCINGDSLILMENNIGRIENIITDRINKTFSKMDTIIVRDESGYGTSGTGYFEKHVKTIKITTREGYFIEGTPEHPIRVIDKNGNISWKNLSLIKSGDHCAIFRTPSLKEKTQEIPILWKFDVGDYINKHHKGDRTFIKQILGSTKSHKFPLTFNAELSRLLGYFIAEGCFDKNGGYISISNTDEYIINDIKKIVKNQFGYDVRIVEDKRNTVKNIVVSSVEICQLFDCWGLNEKSGTKIIPDIVLSSSKEIMREFLRAYFEGDGYVENHRKSIGCCSISKKLIHQIHVLLLEFGIVSSMRKKKSIVNEKDYFSWRISICSENLKKFTDNIGFICERKTKDSLDIQKNAIINPNLDIIPNIKNEIVLLQNKLPIKQNGSLSNSPVKILCPKWYSRLCNFKGSNKNLTYENLKYIRGYLTFFLPHVQLKLKNEIIQMIDKINTLIELNYFYSVVTSIEKGECDVYDISKDGEDKSFIANGFINHNTTTARIVANLLNCENPKEGKVCGKCQACKTIPSGMAMDVIELDGGANGNIENIQELIEGATWAPSELKKKVYIIDECHLLSGKAISALLKIVEEPPEFLTFIFATTEPNKIPSTILSRSQRFNFKKITSKDIVGRLDYIAKQEKITITESALFEIAKISRGCLRDAIVPLEQIATMASGKEITEGHVQKYFGLSDRQGIMKMVSSMISGDISMLMDQVNDMVVASADTQSIAYEISEAFRNIMLLKAQNGQTKLVDLPEGEIEQLKKIGEEVRLGQLDKLARLFSSVKKELEFSINDRWILESTLIHGTALLRKTQ